MSDELLDLVNEKDEIIGTINRADTLGNPSLIHREISITIFNSKRQILLTQRSFKKTVGPGFWSLTAAGHVDKGEDPLLCAQREVKEEVGIDVEPIFIDKYFDQNERETRFFYVYCGLYKGDEIKIDKEEVEDTKWVDLDKAQSEIDGSLGQKFFKLYKDRFLEKLAELA